MKHTLKFFVAALLVASVPAAAHHSFAMFDMQKTITLNGTIVKFKWQNPHSWLELDVPAKTGTERWAVEMTSPNNLALEGWKRSSVKPGDKVTLVIHPLRDASKGGSFVGIRLANGSTLGTVS